jgi:hypothetical protein
MMVKIVFSRQFKGEILKDKEKRNNFIFNQVIITYFKLSFQTIIIILIIKIMIM